MTNLDLAFIIAIFIVLAFFVTIAILVITQWKNPDVRNFVMSQFPVIVCLPTAGLFAFLVIAIFQVGTGQIQFKAFGLEFSGAAGPVIMWVLAFLVIATMIRLLWWRRG
jgi:hypothetical protein